LCLCFQACKFLFGFLDQLEDLSITGEPTEVLLGKDQISAILDLEDSSARPDQFRFDTKLFVQFIRQTGGSGLVVSFSAISNFANIHDYMDLPVQCFFANL